MDPGTSAVWSDDEEGQDYNPLDDGYDSDRLSDTSDWEAPPKVEDEKAHPVQLGQTRMRWEELRAKNADLRLLVVKVLCTMDVLGLNLPIFLSLLCWGNDACISDPKIRYERTGLMVSEELPKILSRMLNPPRSSVSRSHYTGPAAGTKVLESFAADCMLGVAHRELDRTAHLFLGPQHLSKDALTRYSFRDAAVNIPEGAPLLWKIIRGSTERTQSLKRKASSRVRKSRKDHDAVCPSLIIYGASC